VIELEPKVGTNLESDLRRILLVGGVTAFALLVFALGWVRSLRKVEQFQLEADRKKRLVALGQMSSIMAHELRNPLASLKGHAQLLAEQLSEDPKGQAKAELVVHEAERLESLTRNLLEFVRDGAIDTRLVPVRQLAEEALEGLDRERVSIHCDGSPEQVRVDRARIVRALHNLLENALLADPSGRAELHLLSAARGLVIEVRDHGPGLPKEPIFEPFVTTRVRGTGLGLPIARRVAEQHGGALTAENHAEGGALFRLTLPNIDA
jgi:two-component system sensor histidine kinase HydH